MGLAVSEVVFRQTRSFDTKKTLEGHDKLDPTIWNI